MKILNFLLVACFTVSALADDKIPAPSTAEVTAVSRVESLSDPAPLPEELQPTAPLAPTKTASPAEEKQLQVVNGPPQYIYYPNRCQMSPRTFHRMTDSLGIVIAASDEEGNLYALTPVTITTFPTQRGFILEVIEDDPRNKLEIKPGHLGYDQSRQILCCYGIKISGPIYHLYPKSLECKMVSLRDSKHSRDAFWHPSLRHRNVVGVSYGFYRPCLLINSWAVYVKSLTYR